MKRQLFGVFAVLLFVLGAVSVNAQSSRMLKVNVPFGFAVGDVLLPEGEYTVTNTDMAGLMVLLRGPQGTTFVFTQPTEKRGGNDAYELAFHQINDQYFLSTVWMGNDLGGRKVLMSRHEREMTAQVGKPVLRVLTASAR